MKITLLIWNLVLTILLIGLVFSGCTALDPEYSRLAHQVEINTAELKTLLDAANQNREMIAGNSETIIKNTEAVTSLKDYTETTIVQVNDALVEYIKEYVKANID